MSSDATWSYYYNSVRVGNGSAAGNWFKKLSSGKIRVAPAWQSKSNNYMGVHELKASFPTADSRQTYLTMAGSALAMTGDGVTI